MTSHRKADYRQEQNFIKKQESQPDYPVHISFIDLSKMYLRQIGWHYHPEMEILIVNHGEADFAASGRTLHLRAGQGILINQNVMHSVSPSDQAANCSVYSTVFHPSFLFGERENALSAKYLPPVLDAPSLKALFLDEADPFAEKILDLVNSIIAANLMKRNGYELVTKSCLCQLWIKLLEHKPAQAEKASRLKALSVDEERVKKIISYLEEHYAEPITLDMLAEFTQISKSECCRCFKRTLALTPVEYLMQLRIRHAVKILQDHAHMPLSMAELARNTGFHNASYFNKVFRQFMHCTPSEYKRAFLHDPTVSPFYQSAL